MLASLSDTIARKLASLLSLQDFGRLAFIQALLSAATARVLDSPPLRLIPRVIVEEALFRFLAIVLKDKLAEIPRDISSSSGKDQSFEERLGVSCCIPPDFYK